MDRTNIRESEKIKLDRIISTMKLCPKFKLSIVGHTDSYGPSQYNIALGERRAISVKNYLAKLGIEPSRLVTWSFGEEFPAEPNNVFSINPQNRRVTFQWQK